MKAIAIAAVSLLVTAAACGPNAADHSAALATSDLAKDDVQVLSAQMGSINVGAGDATSVSVRLDTAQCQTIAVDGGFQTLDCTNEFEAKLDAVAMHTIQVNNHSYLCRDMIVRTATLKSAVESPVFEGLGFYASEGRGMRLIAKDKLKKVGERQLKDGRAVVVHEFKGVAGCWRGTASSSMYARYAFKPFAQFNTGGDTYRVWENVANDHVVSYNNASSWDRSADLLK